MQDNILLIDDDQDSLLLISKALSIKISNCKVSACTNREKALHLMEDLKPSVIVLDLCLERNNTASGFNLLKELVSIDKTCRIIMLTGHSDSANGIKALELGASNFLGKPAEIDHLAALIKDALNQVKLRKELYKLQDEKEKNILAELVGSSEAIFNLREEIKYASSNNLPVLLTGPTGTGKNLIAGIIHKLSKRSNQRLIRYQPNFTSAEMVNSDLFGHVKGAFTGADANRSGILQACNYGTLFLDEIDELPHDIQVSLLGVLQDKTYSALGSNQEFSSDFRLISACNKPIEESLKSQKIRNDFYHRIANIIIKVPSLEERKEDLPELINYFIKSICEQEAIPCMGITNSSLKLIESYSWPGNIRELKAKIDSAVLFANFKGKEELSVEDFKLNMENVNYNISENSYLNYNDELNKFKKELISKALKLCDNNQVKTAKMLGVDRSTLRRIIVP
jgi:DNA-binding NtrC family response regulator